MRHEAYYSAIAQVIPVLALVIFVQGRQFATPLVPRPRHALTQLALLFLTLVLIALGEAAAIKALYSGDSEARFSFATLGLTFAGGYVCLSALHEVLVRGVEDPDLFDSRAALAGWVFAVGNVVVAVITVLVL